MKVGRLLVPAIRWDPNAGFALQEAAIDTALERGVGGFSIFGGEANAVAELTRDLRARSDGPLLIASDLERGAGQQFRGATPLPPLAAIGSLDDLETTRRAAALTAREALALGVNWIYAPVADVDLEPRNPIIGSRAFGTDPVMVARHVAAWVRGCHEEGALCCAKHFPGHGRTVDDSHAALPRVEVSRDTLAQADLKPFHAAARAGVDSIMTAHVSFPALDASGAAATLSRPIVSDLLRRELDFSGLVVTDALIMEGVLQGGMGEAEAAVVAVAAGCDALLYPRDLDAVAVALERAIGTTLPESRVADSIDRIKAVAARSISRREGGVGADSDRDWGIDIGKRSLVLVRGRGQCARSFDLLTIDDDVGGPFPAPARDRFPLALREGGFELREVEQVDGDCELVISLYSDIRAWKGRPGLSDAAASRVADAVARQPRALVVFFGHPRLTEDVPGETVLAAWGGEGVMQDAAARWLIGAA